MSLVSLVSAGGFFTTNSTWEALSESIQFQLNDIQNERGFPGGSDGKGSSCNAGDLGSIPRSVGKIPWRRAWQPTPVFLPGESPWTEGPVGLQSVGSHRISHN